MRAHLDEGKDEGKPVGAVGDEVDFDAAGRQLLASLNLDGAAPGSYDDLNCVYRDPETGAGVFIGNAQAAANADTLSRNGIKRVVNCQGIKSKNYFEDDDAHPDMTYLRFPVSFWKRSVGSEHAQQVGGAVEYIQPTFAFINEGVALGEGCLIHCLAGAHRAGTTGVAYMMYQGKVSLSVALDLAKQLRPIVSPFAGLLEFLLVLDEALGYGGGGEGGEAAGGTDGKGEGRSRRASF